MYCFDDCNCLPLPHRLHVIATPRSSTSIPPSSRGHLSLSLSRLMPFLSTVQISFNCLLTRSVRIECECTSALLKRNKMKCKITQKHKYKSSLGVLLSKTMRGYLYNLSSMILNLSHGLYFSKICATNLWPKNSMINFKRYCQSCT